MSVEHIVITIMSQRGSDLVYSQPITSSSCTKIIMGTSICVSSLLRMELDITFVILLRLKSDISLKLNQRSDRLLK